MICENAAPRLLVWFERDLGDRSIEGVIQSLDNTYLNGPGAPPESVTTTIQRFVHHENSRVSAIAKWALQCFEVAMKPRP